VLGVIEQDGLVANAARRGSELREIVARFDSPLITEVRGKGLLLGLGLSEPVALHLAAAALAQGLIVNAANETSIRIAPPLIVGDAELADFERRFGLALAGL